jgi:hypothetical protein
MGFGSHPLNNGLANTGIGALSLSALTTASNSTALGLSALRNVTSGSSNTAVGAQALTSATTGTRNIGVGAFALSLANGSDNIGIGFESGNLAAITGSNNIFIGNLVGANIGPAANNQLNIGNWIYGHNGNIGIGQTNPAARLDVNGQIRITGGTPGNGRVLTSDATGLATWQTPAAGGSVLSITANNGLSGGTITTSGTIGLLPIGANSVLGTTAAGVPAAQSLTTMFDTIGNAQGSMLYRDTNLNGWRALAPAASANQVLVSGGPAANPSWATAASIVTAGNAFVQNGNTFGGPAFLGTDDPFALNFQTAGTTRMTLLTDGNVGIGTNTPLGILHTKATSLQAAFFDRAGAGSHVVLRSSQGTIGAETSTLSGNVIGRLSFEGYGTNYGGTLSGIRLQATQNFTNTAMGSELYLTTTPNGAATGVDRLVIKSDGNVGIGTLVPTSKLEVSGGDLTVTGGSIIGGQVISNATSIVNWASGMQQINSTNCTSFTFQNLRPGATYTLVVTGNLTNQCIFPATIDGVGVTYRYRPANGPRSADSHTVYTFMRIGNVIYVSWASDFQL